MSWNSVQWIFMLQKSHRKFFRYVKHIYSAWKIQYPQMLLLCIKWTPKLCLKTSSLSFLASFLKDSLHIFATLYPLWAPPKPLGTDAQANNSEHLVGIYHTPNTVLRPLHDWYFHLIHNLTSNIIPLYRSGNWCSSLKLNFKLKLNKFVKGHMTSRGRLKPMFKPLDANELIR